MKPGDRLDLHLTGLSPAGHATGELSGLTLEVPGAFPGERALVHLEHLSRQTPRAFARLLSILQPHPARIEPPCPHALTCSGCPLQPLDLPAQRAAKRDMLLQRFGLDPGPLVGRDPWGYRWSSKRVVTGSKGNVLVGSYIRGTHTPAAMDECRVDHPAIAAAARELQTLASVHDIVPYDETTGQGDLRYAWFKTDGRDVLLTLISRAAPSRAAELLPPRLRLPAGIAWSVQPGPGNALRGAPPLHLSGRPSLSLSLAEVPFDTGPLDFLQPNPLVAELAYLDLVADPHGTPHSGELAFDLYAGAGVTSALLRRRFATVLACEAYPASAARLGIPPETAEVFLAQSLAQSRAPSLIVANPPRGGMGPAVCSLLARLAAPHLQIMSCSPEALVRDLADLKAADYHLLHLRAYDTLPHTPHVELVAWLSRPV